MGIDSSGIPQAGQVGDSSVLSVQRTDLIAWQPPFLSGCELAIFRKVEDVPDSFYQRNLSLGMASGRRRVQGVHEDHIRREHSARIHQISAKFSSFRLSFES